MFECLVGWPPFCAEDRRDVYRKIVNWQHCLYFPDDVRVGHYAEHLIRRYVFHTPTHTHRGTRTWGQTLHAVHNLILLFFHSQYDETKQMRLPAFAHSRLTNHTASFATARTASAEAGPTS